MIQEAAAAARNQQLQAKGNEEDVSAGNYGSYGLIQSADKKEDINFTELKDVNENLNGQDV